MREFDLKNNRKMKRTFIRFQRKIVNGYTSYACETAQSQVSQAIFLYASEKRQLIRPLSIDIHFSAPGK